MFGRPLVPDDEPSLDDALLESEPLFFQLPSYLIRPSTE